VGRLRVNAKNIGPDQHFLAEPVGFEFYLRHHLSRHSLDLVEISANPGSEITWNPVLDCAVVGNAWANVTDVLRHHTAT
jgi:hypothetical protein